MKYNQGKNVRQPKKDFIIYKTIFSIFFRRSGEIEEAIKQWKQINSNGEN